MNATLRTTRHPALRDVVNEFDAIFDNLFRNQRSTDRAVAPGDASPRVPAVDITESDTAYTVIADLPGIAREDLEITIDDGVLSFGVSPETGQSANDGDTDSDTARVVRRERHTGGYRRTMRLADDVAEDQVAASLKDGVLRLTLPKAPKSEPRKIDVAIS